MSPHRLLCHACLVFLCLPSAATAGEAPWSFELTVGAGTERQWIEQHGLNERRGNRNLTDLQETTAEALNGNVGGIVRYRLHGSFDAFARIDWQGAQDIDRNGSYDFSNGDHISGSAYELQQTQTYSARIGARWSQPVFTGWSVEATLDLRDEQTSDERVYPGPGIPGLMSSTQAQFEFDEQGYGAGLGLRWKPAVAWSLLLNGEFAQTGDYRSTGYVLSLNREWH